jgi:UDP-GlcNAc:undecaprenyl-phosphate GlcNAc-1-phosphate transferase
MLIPIFDISVVTVTRKLSGRPASQGGRDHTSHRLVTLGMSEQRAVFVLDALVLFVFVGASRVSFRLLRTLIGDRARLHPAATPVVIYGAGDGGELLMREILNNPDLGYAPVGFIDDDHHKVGRLIQGCRIFERQALPDLIRTRGVRAVLVSSLKVADSQLADLRPLGVNLRRMTVRIQ